MELNKDMNSGLRMGTTTRFSQAIKLSVLAMGAMAVAHAATISISKYDMLNGEGVATGGTLNNYWDQKYNGVAVPNTSTDKAPLSGGVGDLTDGTIPTLHWSNTGVESAAGAGPYVGWFTIDPLITFQFANGYHSNVSIDLYLDDTDNTGKVNLPSLITVTGYDPILNLPTTVSLTPTDTLSDQSTGPKKITLTFDPSFITQKVEVNLTRGTQNSPNASWIMLAEAQFQGVEVPETGTWAALGLGAVALLQVGRRARASRK